MNDKEKGKEAAIKLVDAISDLINQRLLEYHYPLGPCQESKIPEFKQEIVKILTDPVE